MQKYPFSVAIISLIFGAIVLSQWARRGRPHQLLWGISLLLGAAAAFGYVGFIESGDRLFFFLYYICGGLLIAPFLGMGSLYLVLSRRLADTLLAVLVVLSIIGTALILKATIHGSALLEAQRMGEPGTTVLQPGLWLALLVPLNIFGALTVIGVALYSAYKVIRRQAPRRFAFANIAIAIGVFIVSQAGSEARLGLPGAFWITMVVGFAVAFVGFLLTTSLVTLPATNDRPASAQTASPA